MGSQLVSMNVMLAIHCKRTSNVDLHKPLKSYIRQNFSERDANEAEEDLQVRGRACCRCSNSHWASCLCAGDSVQRPLHPTA